MTPRWLNRMLKTLAPLRRGTATRKITIPPASLSQLARSLIRNEIDLCARLPDSSRQALEPLVSTFLHEKRFEGCNGLEVTERIRVAIAAQACILLLHRNTRVYPRLSTILVYPTEYLATYHEGLRGGGQLTSEVVLEGESAMREVIILAWNHIDPHSRAREPGRNLVLHEFAHQLDREDGELNGTPVLDRSQDPEEWAQVMGAEYNRLVRDVQRGVPTVLDEYATTNPAEFFAVATESFFERPRSLRRKHPTLYGQLAAFYHQDPARWYSHLTIAATDPEATTPLPDQQGMVTGESGT